MNNIIHYIPSNIPNIQYHKLLHPTAKEIKKIININKQIESDKKLILNLRCKWYTI
jgi:hypothetical protein